MNYGDLNLIFLAVGLIAVLILRSRYQCLASSVVLLPMVVLTAIFDNLIVLAKIVGYDPSKLLGISVGVVPIEDFAYTIVAAVLIPTIWKAASR